MDFGIEIFGNLLLVTLNTRYLYNTPLGVDALIYHWVYYWSLLSTKLFRKLETVRPFHHADIVRICELYIP